MSIQQYCVVICCGGTAVLHTVCVMTDDWACILLDAMM